MTAVLRLKPGREKSLLRRHPWVFSGAVERVEGQPPDGATLRVEDSQGQFLAWAAYSSHSQIQARVWSWREEEAIDAAFFYRRLERAMEARRWLLANPGRNGLTDSLRLVHAESDGLPGLVVDRYADLLVAQFLSSGADAWREVIADALLTLTGAGHLYERSDADVRRLEGLDERNCPLRGGPPPERVQINENGLKFWVQAVAGHKTGYYLDQRVNRMHLRQLAAGREVLDCFCYTGGFAVNAAAGGAASVLAVDSSAEALALGQENLLLNGLAETHVEWRQADVFQSLRSFRDARRSFDLIVLDPPKFAPTAAQVQNAARAYKDINLLAFKLLRPGGLLMTFSCSGGVEPELFQKIVAGAALDARVEAQVVMRLSQGPDHPVALNFPEGAYLKGFVARVSDF